MIVIGYSADIYGAAALEHGLAEAKLRDTKVLVINSSKGDAWVDSRFAHPQKVATIGARLTMSGIEHEIRQCVGEDVTDVLLEAMRDDEAELLVIGIRHRTPVGKLLLGSNAQRLLLNCPKPVLAVKPSE